MAAATPLEDQSEAIAFVESGAAFGIAADAVRRIDTHAALVFLAGERAWKLKRAVRFPYLDFSTPELRRAAFEAEFALNQRSAPELYLAVHAVTREADGSLAIGGAGEPVEWLLEMRRFPDGALLSDKAADGIDTFTLMRLADRVIALHATAPPVKAKGAALMAGVIDSNAASFADVADVLDPGEVATLIDAQRRELQRHAATLDARAVAGRVRQGHGDLHLANIALVDGEPMLFDCIEFSSDLATVDILYDLAFLLMDLWHRGLTGHANIVANRYLDVTPQGAPGYALLPLFISVRAAIRAHVRAAASQATGDAAAAQEARDYLALAIAALTPLPLRLLAVGGLSGTGKTTVARLLGARLGRPPGARVLRSDIFRKRLAGVAPETPLPDRYYSQAASGDTYEALFESGDDHLRYGTSVILDAVFQRRSERDVAEALGLRDRVPFTGLWLEAPERDRIDRVTARTNDASDAGPAVVREQGRRSPGELAHWHRMKANRPIEMIIAAARAAIDRQRG